MALGESRRGGPFIEKVWGSEEVLVNQPEYCAKWLRINPGKRSSLHYHRVKKETFIVASGIVYLEQRDVCEVLAPGDSRTIEPLTPHRFSSGAGAVMLEVSMHHDDNDVERLEPSGEII